MRGISWLAGNRLASQEGLCPAEIGKVLYLHTQFTLIPFLFWFPCNRVHYSTWLADTPHRPATSCPLKLPCNNKRFLQQRHKLVFTTIKYRPPPTHTHTNKGAAHTTKYSAASPQSIPPPLFCNNIKFWQFRWTCALPHESLCNKTPSVEYDGTRELNFLCYVFKNFRMYFMCFDYFVLSLCF